MGDVEKWDGEKFILNISNYCSLTKFCHGLAGCLIKTIFFSGWHTRCAFGIIVQSILESIVRLS